ncbi:hypothetical protein Dsin_006152 [Dipteronia sinensis]|uniref:Retrotransposon gag domain-containing protein n=1 Tax=Dipteronia sinensis TaxID=43782 RepID=A0AAE0AZ10_9ROSI|nr:hypothetical protein Dsin_006152 [Dipteronia sinensis]
MVLGMRQRRLQMHSYYFVMMPNYGGDANMVIWAKASTPSAHGRSSRKNSKDNYILLMQKKKKAQGRLLQLKQTGSIRDYVKEFTTLSLEIEDMSEKGLLFYFMDGLKDWAMVELERRNVQDINVAIVEAEALNDYSTQSKEKKANQGKGGGDKSGQRSQGHKEEGQWKLSNTDNRNKSSGGSYPIPTLQNFKMTITGKVSIDEKD